MTRKIWTCDFQGCNEIAQWYRKRKGRLIKVCTKHEARLAREHWGRRVDFSELNDDDIRYLEWKEWKKELVKKEPFEVLLFQLEDGLKVRVRDRQTNEWRLFTVKGIEEEKIYEAYSGLQRKGFSPKPSIDEYVKKLRKYVLKKISKQNVYSKYLTLKCSAHTSEKIKF